MDCLNILVHNYFCSSMLLKDYCSMLFHYLQKIFLDRCCLDRCCCLFEYHLQNRWVLTWRLYFILMRRMILTHNSQYSFLSRHSLLWIDSLRLVYLRLLLHWVGMEQNGKYPGSAPRRYWVFLARIHWEWVLILLGFLVITEFFLFAWMMKEKNKFFILS